MYITVIAAPPKPPLPALRPEHRRSCPRGSADAPLPPAHSFFGPRSYRRKGSIRQSGRPVCQSSAATVRYACLALLLFAVQPRHPSDGGSARARRIGALPSLQRTSASAPEAIRDSPPAIAQRYAEQLPRAEPLSGPALPGEPPLPPRSAFAAAARPVEDFPPLCAAPFRTPSCFMHN